MTEINPVASSTATTTTGSAVNSQTISEDFDTFLQLLTAQIQNQDPLAPIDSTQFVEQLATFSSLEQQVQTNDTLESIASMIGDLHSVLASEWLGEEVAVASKYVAYEGSPVEFEVNPALSYDQAVLTVTDTQGQTVWQEVLDPNAERHQWSGSVLDQKAGAPDGIYAFQLDLLQGGQRVATSDAEIISKVTNLATEDGQIRLGTDTRLTADLTDVRKVSSD